MAPAFPRSVGTPVVPTRTRNRTRLAGRLRQYGWRFEQPGAMAFSAHDGRNASRLDPRASRAFGEAFERLRIGEPPEPRRCGRHAPPIRGPRDPAAGIEQLVEAVAPDVGLELGRGHELADQLAILACQRVG